MTRSSSVDVNAFSRSKMVESEAIDSIENGNDEKKYRRAIVRNVEGAGESRSERTNNK
jgi:hypothetical protein